MSFSEEWLTLREPIDHAARNADVLQSVGAYFSEKEALTLTDVGTGTGSTIRAMAPALSQRLSWRLIDNDASLLESVAKQKDVREARTHLADLSLSLGVVFEEAVDCITTSAFLDLVSEDWLKSFVENIAQHQIPFYAGLTYDGRAGILPPHKHDAMILRAFNAHQKTDKGFGPALGPEAAATAMTLFEEAGYTIKSGLSDWQAGPEHKAFQKMLLEGWVEAALEIRPDLPSDFEIWWHDRCQILEAAASKGASLFVGHVDFFAHP